MDAESVKVLAAGLCMAFGAVGAAIGESWIASKAMDGMARNPEVADKLFTKHDRCNGDYRVKLNLRSCNLSYHLVRFLIYKEKLLWKLLRNWVLTQ